VATEREHRLETLLLDSEPFLVQTFSLGSKRRLIEEVGERPASPERERLLERYQPIGRSFGTASGDDELLEAGGVDGLVGDG
jgi:hypothetical protein